MKVFERIIDLAATPGWRQLLIIAGALLVASLVWLVFSRVVSAFTRKTRTEIDDQLAHTLRKPAAWTVILIGLAWAQIEIAAPPHVDYVVLGVLQTVGALMWAVALNRIGLILLEVVSRRVDQLPWIEPKTLPLFDMILKVVVAGGFLYILCIAWKIPLASWLTSAGIVGIAVGFAAKDTLANLFSGIFIIADAPYKIGDYVVLDNNIRGEVLEIGMRSTRLLTRDDIEVTVPNAVIGNGRIVNQTGGPNEKMRVRIKVAAAYGSDVDQVRDVLMASVGGVEHVCAEPARESGFRNFGDFGARSSSCSPRVDLPVYRGRVVDALNVNVYKSFAEAGIEIPYQKHDVYIKEMPNSDRATDA